MANIFKRNLLSKSLSYTSIVRHVQTTQKLLLKEITVTEQEKVTVIQGTFIPSPREPYMVHSNGCKACPICKLGLDVKHTDVLILHQFVRLDGCMLPRTITGLCSKQQKRISNMVSMAQKAGILTPPGSKSDPSKRTTYKKFNTYFDESTIKTWT